MQTVISGSTVMNSKMLSPKVGVIMTDYIDSPKDDNSDYYQWVDFAKSVLLVLVIIGHLLYCTDHDVLNRAIYSFHVPAFFVLSGIVWKAPYDKRAYIIRKSKRVLFPYVAYALIELGEAILLFIMHKPVNNLIRRLLFMNGRVYTLEPLWFLPVLFEVYLFSLLFNKVMIEHIMLGCISFFVVGGILYGLKEIFPYSKLFGVDKAIICTGFFIFGIMIRKNLEEVNNYVYKAILPLLVVVWFVAGVVFNSKVSVYYFSLGNYGLFLISGLAGSLVLIFLSFLCGNKKTIFGALSKYSILFLGTQYLWILPFKKVVDLLNIRGIVLDALIVLCTGLYIMIMPRIYEFMKQRFNATKIFNGEI